MTDPIDAVAGPDDERPTIVATLDIVGFQGSPEAISEILGMQPTRAGRAGETRYNVLGKPTKERIRESYWALQSTAAPRAPIGEHVSSLLDQVRAAETSFARLPAGVSVTLRCTVIPNGYLPSFILDPSAVRGLGSIGAGFKLHILSIVKRDEEVEDR